MKRLVPLCVTFVAFSLVAQASAAKISAGTDVTKANEALRKAGYSENGLAMIPTDRGNRLAFWKVDEGTLIIVYSIKTNKISRISYWFSDGRPKSLRKVFELAVSSFDTKSGVMMVQTKKPKKRQDDF